MNGKGMNAARAYRRLKEVEEKKLTNRLALLKLELEKSKKKINETQDRTDTINQHKSGIEERHRRKQQELERQSKERELHAQLNARQRQRMAALRQANLMNVLQEKQQLAAQVMDEKKRFELIIEKQKELELARASEMQRIIREQRIQGMTARQKEMDRRREEAMAEFNRRVEAEAKRSKDSEKKVQLLERDELELIRQLEAAQEDQRQAYQDLEVALAASKKTVLNIQRNNIAHARKAHSRPGRSSGRSGSYTDRPGSERGSEAGSNRGSPRNERPGSARSNASNRSVRSVRSNRSVRSDASGRSQASIRSNVSVRATPPVS